MTKCICGTAIPCPIDFVGTNRCAQCDTPLEAFAADVVPHQVAEIDSRLPDSELLGEFCVWFVPQGLKGCRCGKSYSATYSCCPDLLSIAIGLLLFGPSESRAIAIEFIETHASMLEQSPELVSPESSRQLLDAYATTFSRSLRDILVANAT